MKSTNKETKRLTEREARLYVAIWKRLLARGGRGVRRRRGADIIVGPFPNEAARSAFRKAFYHFRSDMEMDHYQCVFSETDKGLIATIVDVKPIVMRQKNQTVHESAMLSVYNRQFEQLLVTPEPYHVIKFDNPTDWRRYQKAFYTWKKKAGKRAEELMFDALGVKELVAAVRNTRLMEE